MDVAYVPICGMERLAVMLPQECPINKPRKRSPKKDGEAVVVRECLLFLKQHPQVIYVERRNTGAVQFADGGFIRFGSKGAADIWCLVNTKRHYLKCVRGEWVMSREPVGSITHVEIECKRADGKGRQSEAQKKFQEFCDSQGIPYILVISATKLAEKLSAIVLDK